MLRDQSLGAATPLVWREEHGLGDRDAANHSVAAKALVVSRTQAIQPNE